MIPLILLIIFYIGIVLAIYKDIICDVKYSGGEELTYIYIGDQLAPDLIAARLPGWKRLEIGAKYADLVMATGKELVDKRLYGVRSRLKCRLDIKDITDKVRFHAHVGDQPFVARTIELTPDTIMPSGAIWIIRANWGFGGSASSVATNTQEMQELRRKYMDENPYRAPPRVIGSEYITDPMMWYPYRSLAKSQDVDKSSDGYKFHLRIYMMCLVTSDGKKRLSMLKNGLIVPAHQKYVAADWSNAEIHDTHGRDNFMLGRFPRDIDNGDSMLISTAEALREALGPLMSYVKCYSESENGYELLGADIMFTADGRCVIIEINDIPGLTWLGAHPEGKLAAQEICDYIFCESVDRVFGLEKDRLDPKNIIVLYED